MTSMENNSTCLLGSHRSYSLQESLSNQQEVELLIRLRQQVDFYFGPANLAKDTYLQKLLQQSSEHGGAVPVSVIASFPKIRELYTIATMGPNVPPGMAPPVDPRLLCRAMESSRTVTISPDELWIIPTNKPSPHENEDDHNNDHSPNSSGHFVEETEKPTKERTTIIVRDLPQHCVEDEVVQAFTTEHVSPKMSRPDVGNTWYLTFASETEAMGALAASQNRTIRGCLIRARLKSELNVPTSHGKVQHSTTHPPPPFSSVESGQNTNQITSTPTPATAATTSNVLHSTSYSTIPLPQLAILHQYSPIPASAQPSGVVFPTFNHYGVSVFPPPGPPYIHSGYPVIPQAGYPVMNHKGSRQCPQRPSKFYLRNGKQYHQTPQSSIDDTKKRSTKRKPKRNSNSRTSPSGEHREQPPDKSPSPAERREEPSLTGAIQSSLRNRKHQQKKKPIKMLCEEHFPALTTNKGHQDKLKESKRLYAEALLKLPTGEPTGQTPS